MGEQVKRRSACDRCHRQKLRCVREEYPRSSQGQSIFDRDYEHACVRCAKAKKSCHTTCTRPGISGRRVSKDVLSPHERILDIKQTSEFTATGLEVWENLDTPPSRTRLEAEHQQDSWEELSGAHETFDRVDINMIDAITGAKARQNSSTDGPGQPLHVNRDSIDVPLDILARDPEFWLDQENLSDTLISPFAEDSSLDIGTIEGGLTTCDKHVNCRTVGGGESHSFKSLVKQLVALNRRLIEQSDDSSCLRRLRANPDFTTERPVEQCRKVYSNYFREYTDRVLSESHVLLCILQRLQELLRSSAREQRAATRPRTSSGDSRASSSPSSIWITEHEDLDLTSSHSSSSTVPPHACFEEMAHAELSNVDTLDFQTVLVVVSSYTCILQNYDALFTEILHMLRVTGSSCSGFGLPCLLPEVSIGKFRLAGPSEFQTKYFLQISAMILEAIEKTLGIGSGALNARAAGYHGLLSDCQSDILLDALYRRKEIIHEKWDGTRMPRARHTLSLIYRVMDSPS